MMSIQSLHEAIDLQNVEVVKYILQYNVNVNSIYCKETALTRAICSQEIKIIEAILANPECDVNAVNQYDQSPLYLASLHGDTDLVTYMLSRGSDVNLADVTGNTGLAASAYYDKYETVEVLIKWGAKINSRNRRGETPLHRASSSLSFNVIEILIKEGSDVNLKTVDGKTPLVATMLTNTDDNANMRFKQVKIIQTLLKNGANPDIQDKRLSSVLHCAVERNDIHIACILMHHGCNMYLKNEDNLSPFEIAISAGKQHLYLATIFLLNGLLLQKYESKLVTELLKHNKYNVTNDYIRMMLVSLFLDNLSDLSNLSNLYDDMIEKKIENMNIECLEIVRQCIVKSLKPPMSLQKICRNVIRANLKEPFLVNLHKTNLPGKLTTFLIYDIQIPGNLFPLLDMYLAIDMCLPTSNILHFVENGVDKDIEFDGVTPLMKATIANNLDVCNFFLQIKADCNYQTHTGDTALHLAARHGHVKIVQLLLKYKCSLSKTNNKGNLPIHEAFINGNVTCALDLLDHSSNNEINSFDERGMLPLHYAVGNNSHNLTSKLIQKGACVNNRDKNGHTVLHVAATKGCIYLCKNIELPALFDSKLVSAMKTASCMMCDKSQLSNKCLNIYKNQDTILNFLLEAGCDRHILNHDNKKAADLAEEYGFNDIIQLLS